MGPVSYQQVTHDAKKEQGKRTGQEYWKKQWHKGPENRDLNEHADSKHPKNQNVVESKVITGKYYISNCQK